MRGAFEVISLRFKMFFSLLKHLSDSPSLHFSCTPTQQKHIRKGVNWPIFVDIEKTSTEEPEWRFSERLFQMSWMKRSLSLWILTGSKTNVSRYLFSFDYRRRKINILLFRIAVFLCCKSSQGGSIRDSLLQLTNSKKWCHDSLSASLITMFWFIRPWSSCPPEDQNMLSNKADCKWRCLLDMFCPAGTQTFPSSEGFHIEVCSYIIYSLIYAGGIQNSLCKENLWPQHVNKMKQEFWAQLYQMFTSLFVMSFGKMHVNKEGLWI